MSKHFGLNIVCLWSTSMYLLIIISFYVCPWLCGSSWMAQVHCYKKLLLKFVSAFFFIRNEKLICAGPLPSILNNEYVTLYHFVYRLPRAGPASKNSSDLLRRLLFPLWKRWMISSREKVQFHHELLLPGIVPFEIVSCMRQPALKFNPGCSWESPVVHQFWAGSGGCASHFWWNRPLRIRRVSA